LSSTGFKFSVVGIVLIFGAVGVQLLGIYDYNELGHMAALRTPFQLFKRTYQKFVNEDSPWPAIDVVPRLDPGGWPAGLSKPEVKTADKAKLIAEFPMPALRDKLSKAVEYRL